MLFTVLALVVAFAAASESNPHAHGHGRELCGCAKDEPDHPFILDCNNAQNIRDAAARLSAQTPSAAACQATDANGILATQSDFFVIQAHHDYCDHDTLTTAEETLFHDWEDYCLICGIERGYESTQDACPRINCQDTSVIDAAYWILNNTCLPSAGDGHAHRRLSEDEFEWGGIFPDTGTLTAGTYTWVAQATGSPRAFVDPAMKFIFYQVSSASWSEMFSETLHANVNTAFTGACTTANAGDTLVAGTCYNMQFPSTVNQVTFDLTFAAGRVAIFAEHVPTEFEFDTHYLNLAGVDVEPAVQTSDGHCCNNAHQIGAFKQVVAYHDLCDHDDVPYYVETGLHDFEANCEAHFCNAVTSTYDGTVCPSPPAPPPEPPPDSIETTTVVAIVVSIGAVLVIGLIFMCVMISRERQGTPIFTNVENAKPSAPTA